MPEDLITWISQMADYMDDWRQYGEDGANRRWQYRLRDGEVWNQFDGDIQRFKLQGKFVIRRKPFGYERGGYTVTPIDPDFPPKPGTKVFVPRPNSTQEFYVTSMPWTPGNPAHQRLLKEYTLFETEELAVIAIKADKNDIRQRVEE